MAAAELLEEQLQETDFKPDDDYCSWATLKDRKKEKAKLKARLQPLHGELGMLQDKLEEYKKWRRALSREQQKKRRRARSQ
jgi:hypothetical protein